MGRHAVDEAARDVGVAAHEHGEPVLAEKPGRELPVPCGERKPHRLDRIAVPGVPPRRAAVELRQLVAKLDPRVGPQELAEQPVVAVPAGLLVLDEEVVAEQPRERPVAVDAVGERVGQLPGEPVDDRRGEQEPPQLGRLRGEHLGGEIVGDGALLLDVPGDPLARIAPAAERHGEQLEPRGPALRPYERGVELRLVEPGQQRPGLLAREGEVGGAYLGQLTAHPQEVERQARVGARGEHDAKLLGRPVEQLRDGDAEVGRRGVEVVHDDDHGRVELREAVDEAVEESRRRLAPRRLEPRERRARGNDGAERGDELRPERRLARLPADGEPGQRAGELARGRPRREQHGLPRARVRGDEGERPVLQAVVQPVEEALPQDERRGEPGHDEIRRDHDLGIGARRKLEAGGGLRGNVPPPDRVTPPYHRRKEGRRPLIRSG